VGRGGGGGPHRPGSVREAQLLHEAEFMHEPECVGGSGAEGEGEEGGFWFEQPWQSLPHVRVMQEPGLTREAFQAEVRVCACV